MSCNHPNKAFWSGSYTETGKKDYIICPGTDGDVLNINVARKRGHTVTTLAPLMSVGSNTFITEPLAIPCGACVGCRMDRAKQWKIRLAHECQCYPEDQVHFITLTYRDSCLPNIDGSPCLKKEDIQDFMNNLRNPAYGVHRQFRYFCCGEYGTLGRPHYHAILFGPLNDLVPFAPGGRCHSKALEKAWPFGLSEAAQVHPNMLAYVAGYVEKKQADPLWDTYPVKPFLMMSTRPMIGYRYIERIKGDDRHVYGNFGKVHHASIPRAYLKKLEDEEWMPAFKEESQRLAKESLTTSLGAVGITCQDELGNIKDNANLSRLEKLRSLKL